VAPATSTVTASGNEPRVIDPRHRIDTPGQHADVAFAPSPEHSKILTTNAPINEGTFHGYRGTDGLPRLDALSPVFLTGRNLTIMRRALRVRTVPGGTVAAWADQLGSFANGARGIVVQADDQGIATIDVLTGNDVGGYPILVASPERSGVLTFTIQAN
jgi:hypothetical protein